MRIVVHKPAAHWRMFPPAQNEKHCIRHLCQDQQPCHELPLHCFIGTNLMCLFYLHAETKYTDMQREYQSLKTAVAHSKLLN